MRKIILIFIVISNISCQKKSKIILLKNNSNFNIYNIKITNGADNSQVDSLKINDKINVELSFEKINTDGICKINYKINNKEKEKFLGYFTNGLLSPKVKMIEIKNDTILVLYNLD